MMLLGIFIIFGKRFNPPFGRFITKKILDKSTESMLLLEFLLGIIPCGPIAGVFTYIGCMSENIFSGAVYAFSFGIGNVVSPIILGIVSSILPGKIFSNAKVFRVFQILCGVILVVFGLQIGWNVYIGSRG